MRNNNSKCVILHEGQFIRFVREGKWEYVKRNNCSGLVIIIAMTDEGKVIFVEQFRPPVGKMVIEFPAGLVNDRTPFKVSLGKEGILEAAKRELLEETGYTAKRITKILEGPVAGGMCSDLATIVKAEGLKKVAVGGGDPTEKIIIHEVPLGKVKTWLKTMTAKGKLVEPKIYAGLYFLHQYN